VVLKGERFKKKEASPVLFVPWFANFQFLMFAIPVIRRDKDEYDKEMPKFDANNFKELKRKDRRCCRRSGPTKYVPFMDRSRLLGTRL